ncbi:9507_t:CDS:1, partial [Scutellospora calospora]
MLDESEKLKRSKVVHKLIKEEAAKNYLPLVIMNVIKDYATRMLDLGLSVKKLKCTEVTNIKYKVCEVQNNHLGGNKDKKSDLEE